MVNLGLQAFEQVSVARHRVSTVGHFGIVNAFSTVMVHVPFRWLGALLHATCPTREKPGERARDLSPGGWQQGDERR